MSGPVAGAEEASAICCAGRERVLRLAGGFGAVDEDAPDESVGRVEVAQNVTRAPGRILVPDGEVGEAAGSEGAS